MSKLITLDSKLINVRLIEKMNQVFKKLNVRLSICSFAIINVNFDFYIKITSYFNFMEMYTST